MALPNLVIWAIVLPCGVCSYLYKNRKALDDQKIKGKFSFLYKGYKNEIFYWEFLIMFRKFLMIATLVFLGNISENLQAILLHAIMSFSAIIHGKSHPYYISVANNIEFLSLSSILIASIAGLYFLNVAADLNLDNLISSLYTAAISIFVLIWIGYFLRYLYLNKKDSDRKKKASNTPLTPVMTEMIHQPQNMQATTEDVKLMLEIEDKNNNCKNHEESRTN